MRPDNFLQEATPYSQNKPSAVLKKQKHTTGTIRPHQEFLQSVEVFHNTNPLTMAQKLTK
jgi:hypothetical protein